MTGNDTQNSVCRYSHQHSEHTGQVTGNKQHYEYLQRAGFNTGRVNQRLEYEVVHKLGHDEDQNQQQYEAEESCSDSGHGKFQHDCEQCSDYSTEKRSHIRDYVQNTSDKRDTYGSIEPNPGYQP